MTQCESRCKGNFGLGTFVFALYFYPGTYIRKVTTEVWAFKVSQSRLAEMF